MSSPALNDRACPLCGTYRSEVAISCQRPAETLSLEDLRPYWFGIDKQKHFFTYHRCQCCKLLYNPTFFDDAQLASLYGAMPPNMDLVPTDAIAATQHGYFMTAARALGAELTGGFLEIGPDVGHLVRFAAEHGQFDRFWLFEPNRAVHQPLRSAALDRPVTILPDMHDLSAVPDGSVGLAVMVHVLDHLLDPLGMVRTVRRKLRPGGVFLIVTHNENSVLRHVLRTAWQPFCLQHPQLFNPVTITRLLYQAGFDDVEVRRSTNHFPIDFLARQALQAFGETFGLAMHARRLPLPRRTIALRLGNILTLARAQSQAAEDRQLAEMSAE